MKSGDDVLQAKAMPQLVAIGSNISISIEFQNKIYVHSFQIEKYSGAKFSGYYRGPDSLRSSSGHGSIQRDMLNISAGKCRATGRADKSGDIKGTVSCGNNTYKASFGF